MLLSMRRGANTWVAKILFILIGMSFAAWGLGNISFGNSKSRYYIGT